ncbi:hypothetical protein MYU51_011329 [Penicillium brevicompactum]
MATMAATAAGRSPKPMRFRNLAVFSIFGMLSGSWLMFRFLAQRRGAMLANSHELASFRSGESKRTDQGSYEGEDARTLRNKR